MRTRITSIDKKLQCYDSGRLFLTVSWRSIYESKNFKLHPEVSSWDVNEGTNQESRKLFIGVNYDGLVVSNRHIHIFF